MVMKMTGISYRQIQYWDTSGFFGPNSGERRYYTRPQIFLMYIFLKMREERLASLRKIKEFYLPKLLRMLQKMADNAMEDIHVLIGPGGVVLFSEEEIDGDLPFEVLVFSFSKFWVEAFAKMVGEDGKARGSQQPDRENDIPVIEDIS